MQKDLGADRLRLDITQQNIHLLEELAKAGRLRHGVAGMAAAIHDVMLEATDLNKIENSHNLQFILLSIYRALAGNGEREKYVINNLLAGMCDLICTYYPKRHRDLKS